MKNDTKRVLFLGFFVFVVVLLVGFLTPESNTLTKPIIVGLSVLIIGALTNKLFPNKS